jgi:NADH:ubiquinone oxidoreductase subunit C
MTASSRNTLEEWLQESALDFEIPRDRRIFVTVAEADFRKTVEELIRYRFFTGISTVTGVNIEDEIEVIYHFTRKGLVLSVKTRVSKNELVLPTITDLIPGSAFYEREVHDLFGVKFEGNLDLSPLVLPDHWPSGVYPLRKEWNAEKIREKMGEA